MVLKSDKEKVKRLLAETIRLLCKNGLHFRAEFCVEALVGITLDKEEEFFLSIKETVQTDLVTSTEETPPPPPVVKRPKERKIKVEGGSSCSSRKRPSSQTITTAQELPSLSLGDEGTGGEEFWSSIPGSSVDSEHGQIAAPFKKRHIEPEDSEDNEVDDGSNSTPLVKGEPDSDSDVEISGTEPATSAMGLHSSYVYGGQSSSMGPVPPQVWDQLPPFSTMPGMSGIPSTSAIPHQPQDPQQLQMEMSRGDYPMALVSRKPQNGYERVAQKILLSKGHAVTPRIINSNLTGRFSVDQITQVMKQLDTEGLGQFVVRGDGEFSKLKNVFVKKEASEIVCGLVEYGVIPEAYVLKYNTPGRLR